MNIQAIHEICVKCVVRSFSLASAAHGRSFPFHADEPLPCHLLMVGDRFGVIFITLPFSSFFPFVRCENNHWGILFHFRR
jgi:hypothetical protein